MANKPSEAEVAAAVRLLKKNSSINAVSMFLKRRGLRYSATSWDELVEVRLKRFLQDGTLDRNDLVHLMRESEEFGRQHVFLYRCPKNEASTLTNEVVIRQRLHRLDITNLMDRPRIVEIPPGFQLVDIRIEASAKGPSLVIKGVGVRSRRNLVNRQEEGRREILTYEWEEDRAVSVLRVASDGMTEVRIQSYRNAVDYAHEAQEFYAKCTGILDPLKFEEWSLAMTRFNLVKNRSSLAGVVRFAENSLRSKKGWCAQNYERQSDGKHVR